MTKQFFLSCSKPIGWLRRAVMFALMSASFAAVAQEATDDNTNEQGPDADPGYRYLLKDMTTTISSQGVKTTRLHNRIEIQKQHAVNTVGDVSIPYNAFRGAARVVKAFTQTGDGRSVELKKDSVRDLTPEEVSSCQMYTDVHQLMFSMPALGKGAIMDYEVEIEEKKPVMPGEFWFADYLDSSVLICTSRVAVTFPAKREVKIVTTNLSESVVFVDATNGSARTLSWEMKNVPALEYEEGMPPYPVVRALVSLTSVKSWQQVEDWYAGLAKKQLREDEEIRKQAQLLIKGLTNQLDQIQALYRYASHDVRYVGVELGRSAYEPHAPRETMQNKYGDCKDKAALLVSLLGAAGIPAHLAIVRPNYEGPVDLNLPGPSQFSHAIIYVPRANGDLWIDATEPFGEVTEHGYHLDDVDAMVVGLPGKTFVRIPVPDETHSIHRLIFDVDVHYGGLCTVHELQEYVGRAATDERDRRSRLDAEKARKQLEHNFGSEGGYSRLLNYSFTNPTNDWEPVRVLVDYDSDTYLTATKTGFSVRFDAASLREWLDVPRPDPASARKHKRLYPWVSRMAHTEEIICRLHLPQGYELAHTPTATRKELPHGVTEMLYSKSPFPCLTLRVIRRPAHLEPGSLPEIAQQVDQAIGRLRASLDMEDSVNALMREHRYAKAEAEIQDAVKQGTNSVDAMIRLGSYYKSVGRVYQSQRVFEKVVAAAPRDPRGYEMLSDTYTGFWGTPGEGFDRKSIMGILDRALTNVAVRAWTIQKQADVCLIDDQGRDESTNRLDEAAGYFRQLLKDDAQNYEGLFGLAQVARVRGNYDEAEDYYHKAARVKPDETAPKAGIWIAMAYAGRDEEAYNAMSAYYGPGEQMAQEAARVAQLLTMARHYEKAANLYDRMVESSARPDAIQKLSRLLRKIEKAKRDDYGTFYDDSTPESLAQTIIIASILNDTNRAFRCLAPVVNRGDVVRSLQEQLRLLKTANRRMEPPFFLDTMLAAFEVSRRTLDNGDVEVKLDASKSTTFAASAVTKVFSVQMQRAGNRWQVITMDAPEADYPTLAHLSLAALQRGDLTNAIAYQTRIAELSGKLSRLRNAPSFDEHLKEIAFTNDALRVKAWAGMALAAARSRAPVLEGLACLDEVSAAYPDDTRIKLAIAYARRQTADVRKAAEILDTISLAKLAAPDQLAQLAWMLLDLKKLDAADQVLTRLRAVAPGDEQLLALQTRALIYRAKFTEAAAAIAKLRERAKLDNRMAIGEECLLITASNDAAALRDLIDRSRENEKPLARIRSAIGHACLALDLNAEASEQIATMVSEGETDADTLVNYAEVALADGDIAEARDLLARAVRLGERFGEIESTHTLAQMHLALGNYREAARGYYNLGTQRTTDYSGYSLCLSALASRFAGDTKTAAETLTEAATMQGDSDWPRLAIQFVSGSLSEDEFRHAPERTAATPFHRASRECEVNCLIGLVRELKHDLPGAIAAYQASLATKSAVDSEYFIAKQALQRLQPAVK